MVDGLVEPCVCVCVGNLEFRFSKFPTRYRLLKLGGASTDIYHIQGEKTAGG